MYRSSFPIVKWDLNDEDNALTKAEWAWADRTSELPERGTPGAEVDWAVPSGYAEPTRAGFEFAGWSTDKSAPAGGYLNADPKLVFPEGAPESGEYTLYALWTPNEYSVVFELAKNPDVGEGPGSDASFALNWSSADGVRTVTDLGNGRYRVDGFTMAGADYDPVTRTVKLPEPARTGYRFLGWAEADDASGVVVDGTDGYALNPVWLPQIDGTPVLTARWASAFGVTAPLSITFGDYDKTGAPANPSLGDSSNAASDTTQSEVDDVETPGLTDQERYEALGAAYFENTGWNDPIKMVGIASERTENAGDVLTTYDSKKATEAAVLGDGTAANPGERLLSLYPAASAPADKSTGVHFRLSDSLEEGDLAKLPSIAAKAKQPVTYGLNLATDPVDGSANHGLVLPTDDYDRKQIATVSYTFATADAADEEPILKALNPTGSTSDPLYVTVDSMFLSHKGLSDSAQAGTYGLADIKAAADDLSVYGVKSPYYPFYKALLDAQMTNGVVPGPGPYFKVEVRGRYLDVQLIGICQDTKAAGGKAGLTFQTLDIYACDSIESSAAGGGSFISSMNSSSTNNDGWKSTAMRERLRTTFWNWLDADLRAAIAPLDKFQQLCDGVDASKLQKTTDETIWLPSLYEVYGTSFDGYNESEALTGVAGYEPFQYQAYWGNNGNPTNTKAIKKYNGSAKVWWTRSAHRSNSSNFAYVYTEGTRNYTFASNTKHGPAPCFAL